MRHRRVPIHLHLVGNYGANPVQSTLFISRCNYINFRVSAHAIPIGLERKYGFSRHFAKLIVEKVMQLSVPNVDRIIQLDADMVFLDDIGKLWKLFDNFSHDQAIGLVPEFNGMYDQSDQYRYHENQNYFHGVKSHSHAGFNTGTLLMDMKKLRAMNWWSSLQTVLDDTRSCSTPMKDQDVMNEYLYRNQRLQYVLPFQWNA
jgi:lipopolysaccharide biosynthesis glycosyltransferase